MIPYILYEVNGRRFLAYAFLLYVIAATSGSLFYENGAEGSPVFFVMPLILMPIAQAFLLLGVKKRWPHMFVSMVFATTGLWIGAIIYAVNKGF